MPRRRALPALFLVLATGCTSRQPEPGPDTGAARAAIAAQIARSVEATRDKDIDAFQAVQTSDFMLVNDTAGDEHGEHLTKAQLRADILRDWSVIAVNRTIDIRIDSLDLGGDSAIVYTHQHYDRLMHEPEGPALDTIVTEVKHREIWRRTADGWREARVTELWHGPILVNGRVYRPRTGL
jgi:Domain of unknown function (DUF4440)